MGLGILQDHHLENVPGTAHVLDGPKRRKREHGRGAAAQTEGLKYDASGEILLVPQPSDDPNDPLNWSMRKRDTILVILSITSILATTLSPILAANTVALAIYFGHNFTDMALLTGYHLLGVGLAGFLFVPSARIWGKRHTYILGCVIIIISTIWAGATGPRYTSFLWARIMQGVGLAPFEALVNASVGDMYFVHERGVRMAVTNFCVFGGSFFTPVVAGVISDRIGYQWTFYFVAIFVGCMLPFIVLFVPETAFRRESRYDIDTMGNLVVVVEPGSPDEGAPTTTTTNPAQDHATTMDKQHAGPSSDSQPITPASSSSSASPPPTKHSFRESLRLFNGRKSDQGYLHLLLRPFPLFLHPGVLWACLIQGTLIGFTVLIGIVLAGIMFGPPLWFSEVETGYMYTGAFLGALTGFLLCGLISDPAATYLTRLNAGTYEPEFRMVLVLPQLLLGGAGIIGFGWTSEDAATYGWVWPDFFFGMVVAGMIFGAVGSALYLVDAHRAMSVESFTCLLVFKNIFSFALTFKGFDWITKAGNIKDVFVAVGCVQIAICLLTLPMYVFGKRCRSFFHRHDVFFAGSDWVADRLTFWSDARKGV